MNNGYQKYNGCGADKEGGKIFNTFFYPELQSKHVRPLAYNVLRIYAVQPKTLFETQKLKL